MEHIEQDGTWNKALQCMFQSVLLSVLSSLLNPFNSFLGRGSGFIYFRKGPKRLNSVFSFEFSLFSSIRGLPLLEVPFKELNPFFPVNTLRYGNIHM